MNNYIRRKLQSEIEKWINRPEILAIRGPRQSGKTTLLEHLKLFLTNENKIVPENIIYLSFEDKSKLANFSKDPAAYIESFLKRDSKVINNDLKREKYYFLLDEFQYVKDGGSKLKLLYDNYKNIKFLITGSSSLELTGKTIKYLVGRVFLFDLYQFDFEEYLNTREYNILNYYREKSKLIHDFLYAGREVEDKNYGVIFESELEKYFEEFCIYGGYPEVAISDNAEEKRTILENIFNTYIGKDIVDLLRLKDDLAVKNIILLCANQIGNVLEYSSLMSDSGTYFKKLKNYLAILEETYIICRLKPFFTNITSEVKKNPKVFFIDNGLRNSVVNNFNPLNARADSGSLVENTVFSMLLKNKFSNMRYWRTISKAEVDFVFQFEGQIYPVEVKYSKMKSPLFGRSFISFVKKYKPKRGLILTKNFWALEKIENTQVLFAPAWFL